MEINYITTQEGERALTILELQNIGLNGGVSAILDAIYGTKMEDCESAVYDKIDRDSQLGNQLISKFITNKVDTFIENFIGASIGA